jgi:flavodoxin
MARVAIVYKSIHHGNTKKLLDGLKTACEVDLFEVDAARHMDMSDYDVIGYASGIYMAKIHGSIYTYLEEQTMLPKKTFIIITSGSNSKKYGKVFSEYLRKKGLDILGIYSCKGFDTYGIFKLIGGKAKHHPNDSDIEAAVSFINEKISTSL